MLDCIEYQLTCWKWSKSDDKFTWSNLCCHNSCDCRCISINVVMERDHYRRCSRSSRNLLAASSSYRNFDYSYNYNDVENMMYLLGVIIGIILALSLVCAVVGFLIMLLWNSFIVGMVPGVQEISWLQAWGISILISLIIKLI